MDQSVASHRNGQGSINLSLVHVVSAVDQVAFTQGFLQEIGVFPCQYNSINNSSALMCRRRYLI